MSPAQVDATPVWKIAAFLGADIDRDAERRARRAVLEGKHLGHMRPQPGCPLCDETSDVPSGGALIAARLAHARGEGPAPEPAPTHPGAAPLLDEGLIQ